MMMMSIDDAKHPILLEICVDDIAGVAAAIDGGADRIELCSALPLGGLTPSIGLVDTAMALAKPLGIAVHAMLRPRVGDFVYDPDTFAIACDDSRRLADVGVDGLVFGASQADGQLDQPSLERWMAIVQAIRAVRRTPLVTTLHRSIDIAPDLDAAIDHAVAIGFDHVLSSGGARTALAGAGALARMRERAGHRCAIIAGAGVKAANVAALLDESGVGQIHGSASGHQLERTEAITTLGFGPAARRVTDRDRVRELRRALDDWQAARIPLRQQS